MKNLTTLTKLAVAVVIASLTLAGESHAGGFDPYRAPGLDKALTTFDSNFNVDFTAHYNNGGDDTNPDAVSLSNAGAAHIQSAIRANRPLARRLESRGVNIDDVVNAQEAADGSVTFWLR